MSRINFYEDTMKDASIKDALQKKISIVLGKIHETDADIQWYIFDEYNKPDKTIAEIIIKEHYGRFLKDITPSFFLQNSTCPGLANPTNKTIWIYKNVIHPAPVMSPFLQKAYEQIYANVYGTPKNDNLANILMDEIAHIKTGKNHGDNIYDSTLHTYIKLYYNV